MFFIKVYQQVSCIFLFTQQNVSIIIMLTNLIEDGKKKCNKYWPEKDKSSDFTTNHDLHDALTVTLTEESEFATYTKRNMLMKMTSPNSNNDEQYLNIGKIDQTRAITQFHFVAWPDKGVPKSSVVMASFLTMVRGSVHEKAASRILVHCSAGVGRTGTFIALFNLVDELKAKGGK